MSSVAIISGCAIQAMFQSLATGAACTCILVLLPGVFSKLGEQGKYLLCNFLQLVIAATFSHPFLSVIFSTQPSAVHAAQDERSLTSGIIHSPAAITERPLDAAPYEVTGRLLDILGSHSPLIFELYLVGLTLFLLRLVFGYYTTIRLRREGLTEPDQMWSERISLAFQKLRIRHPVRLAFSSLVESPCIIGWTKAVILIPVSLASRLSPEQAEALLLHELAHYRQLHSYINLGAQIAISFLFFNPFAWFIHIRAARHREYASDAMAIRHSMQISLAESLLIIAEQSHSRNPLSLGILNRGKQLSHRIQNLLQMQKHPSNFRPAAIAFCIAALIACCSYKQLRAVPAKAPKSDTLEVIARSMHSAGNTNFVIVLALRDSLIRAERPFELKYEDGGFYLDDKLLPEPLQSRYVSLFMDLPEHTRISMWRTESDGVKLKDVFDPKSSFRSYVAVKSRTARDIPLRKESPAPPVQQIAQMNSSERLIKSLIADRIIDTLQPVFLTFENSELFVNGRRLGHRMESKYKDILKRENAFEADARGENSMQIYPEGVLAPSSTSGNSKMQFPRHPGHKPYALQISDKNADDRLPSLDLLKQEILADQLADSAFTIHVVYNTNGIFVNSVKLGREQHNKYARLLTDELKFSVPRQRRDMVDITF